MDNASNALIISATILIALMVLSLGVYLVASYVRTAEVYEQTVTRGEIEKFNSNFVQFENRTDISPQEIITLKKFALEYKEKNNIETTVEIIGTSITSNPINIGPLKRIKDDAPNSFGEFKKYTCISIIYNDDGRVSAIYFRKTI